MNWEKKKDESTSRACARAKEQASGAVTSKGASKHEDESGCGR